MDLIEAMLKDFERIMQDTSYMEAAIEQARAAAAMGEVPVGCVIVHNAQIIAAAHNRRETSQNALAHAELLAIDIACKKLSSWRLSECDLYVTLEPCPMCMGAIINSRVSRVVYGAADPKGGCLGSLVDLTQLPFNHKPEVHRGVCGQECGHLLREFFEKLRDK